MDLGIEGRVAWVLGASSGLGRACAATLAGEGARVAVSARREELLKELAADLSSSGGECVAVPLDVTDRAAIAAGHRAVASGLGPIDILVANAGGPPPGGFEDIDDAQNRPGRGHLTINGASLCEGDGRWLQTHPTERITVEDFLSNPCSRCFSRINGDADAQKRSERAYKAWETRRKQASAS